MSVASGDTLHFRINHAMDVLQARREGMEAAQSLGFSQADATKIAVVISELGRNIVNYAGNGTITVITHYGVGDNKYLKIIAEDHGPGIGDLESALAGGQSTSGGLGLGLSGSKRLMDDFSIHSKAGEGTKVVAVKWLR